MCCTVDSEHPMSEFNSWEVQVSLPVAILSLLESTDEDDF